MSGFTKSVQNRAVSKSEMEMAIGIPTLDSLAKIAPGAVTAVYEDESSFIHNMMLQIFMSQSLNQKSRKTYVLSSERKHLFYFDRQKHQQESDSNGDPKLMIAWRYLDLNPRKMSFAWNLSSRIPIDPENVVNSLGEMLQILKSEKNCNIALFSMFSPLFEKMERSAALKLLFDIRKYSKMNEHVVLASIPTFLIDFDPAPFLDNILSLSSLLAMPHEKFRYSCILELVKLTSIGHLEVKELNSLKYGVRISPKQFLVEQIDIPPEENTASPLQCGSSF